MVKGIRKALMIRVDYTLLVPNRIAIFIVTSQQTLPDVVMSHLT